MVKASFTSRQNGRQTLPVPTFEQAALLRAVVVVSRNEARSEFCVLSSEFEMGDKRETSGTKGG